jgi:hypothetical protein
MCPALRPAYRAALNAVWPDSFSKARPIQTSDWKKHAADLETEMLKRGMFFEVIDWFEGQGKLPFGD